MKTYFENHLIVKEFLEKQKQQLLTVAWKYIDYIFNEIENDLFDNDDLIQFKYEFKKYLLKLKLLIYVSFFNFDFQISYVACMVDNADNKYE